MHPHVHEEYPCSVCIQENKNRNSQQQSECDYYKIASLEHGLELSQQRIAELEQRNDELAATVERLRDTWQSVGGCGDHSCYLLKPEGMGTNGSCRCYGNRSKMMTLTRRMNAVFQQSPHQSLAERDAKVANKAFIAGVGWCNECHFSGSFACEEDAAEQYAEKIRNGKDGE